MLAGVTSGVGKTSITCAIIYALQKKGFSVQPFKVGPDYIDPIYLSSISKTSAFNLDVWLMGKEQLLKSFIDNSKSDISIIEGVMGFYDGFKGGSSFASTYHVANITESPVILVLDASKAARSVAAIALGFQKFHKSSRISGIILNKIGSHKHEQLCRDALEKIKIPIVGVIPKDSNLVLESRHLGLVSTQSKHVIQKQTQSVSKTIANFLDIDKIIDITKNLPSLHKTSKQTYKKPQTTIAVALDNSFNFYYYDNLESLRRHGARLKFFSPILDKQIPTCDGLYLGGGFPEILGANLEKNSSMRKSIKKLSEENAPIYAECGGLMYLTKSINYGNKKYRMVGLFDAETSMTHKMKLNYTKGKILSSNIISDKPHMLHGHEFHYSELSSISSDSKFAYKLDYGIGIQNNHDGLIQHNTLASYGHLYFDSSDYSRVFVKSCMDNSRR